VEREEEEGEMEVVEECAEEGEEEGEAEGEEEGNGGRSASSVSKSFSILLITSSILLRWSNCCSLMRIIFLASSLPKMGFLTTQNDVENLNFNIGNKYWEIMLLCTKHG